MQKKINELKKLVGKPYKMFFEDGNYCGCFFPIYEVYPDLPRHPLFSENMADNWDYGINLILESAYEIPSEEVKAGDVLVTKYRKELHVALCIGEGKIIQVFRDRTLEISRAQNCFRERFVKYFRLRNV